MRLNHRSYRNCLQAETIRTTTKSDRAASKAERESRIEMHAARVAPMLDRLDEIEGEARRMAAIRPSVRRACTHCGVDFDAVVRNDTVRKTCSDDCRYKATAAARKVRAASRLAS